MANRWIVVVACVGALLAIGPLFSRIKKGFVPEAIRPTSRSACARPRAPAWQRPRSPCASASRARFGRPSHSSATAIHDHRRQRAAQPQRGQGVRQAHRPQRAPHQSAGADGAHPQRHHRQAVEGAAHRRVQVDAFNSGQSTAAVQYGISGPDLASTKLWPSTAKSWWPNSRKVPGAVASTPTWCWASRRSTWPSTAKKRRRWACRWRTLRRPCSS